MSLPKEKGYALVLTIAVLVGMLVMIVPLVLLNSRHKQEINANNDEMQARFGLELALNLKEAKCGLWEDPQMKPEIVKNSLLPGWSDIPLLINHGGQVSGTGAIRIKNPVPVMMYTATALIPMPFDIPAADPMVSDAIAASPAFSAQLRTFAANNMLAFVGNEIFVYKHADFKLYRMSKLGGISHQSHMKGDWLYATQHKQFYTFKMTSLRVDGEWFQVTGVELNNDEFFLRTSPTASISTESVVEFFPFRIGDYYTGASANPKASGLFLKIESIDEYSKVNINSITGPLLSKFQLEGMLDFAAQNIAFPFRSVDSLLKIPDLTDQANAAGEYPLFRSLRPLLTTFSDPDPYWINSANLYSFGAGDMQNFADVSALVLKKDANGAGSYETANSTVKQSVYMHPVNFNTASVYVMYKMLEAMELPNPYTLATKIEQYRSGENSGQTISYLDGNENPFDGVDNKNPNNLIRYSSAEEEFIALMETESLNAAQLAIVRDHIYIYRDKRDYKNSPAIAGRIGFEASETRTTIITAGTQRMNRLTALKNSQKTAKNLHAMGNDALRDVVLSAANGWNQHLSTFKGVEWRPVRPRLAIDPSTHGSLPAGERRWEFDISDVPLSGNLLGFSANAYFRTNGIHSINGNDVIVKTTDVAKPPLNASQANLYGPCMTLDNIDFGLRVRSKEWTFLMANPTSEPYIWIDSDPDAVPEIYYETNLIAENAEWVELQWLVRNDYPGVQINVSINGIVSPSNTGNSSSISGEVNLRPVSNNDSTALLRCYRRTFTSQPISEHMRVRFTFVKTSFHNAVARQAGTLAGTAINPQPFACPQLYKIRATYRIKSDPPVAGALPNPRPNTITYETR